MRLLSNDEKLQVFKKLSHWCRVHSDEDNEALLVSLNTGLSETTLFYLYGSNLMKSNISGNGRDRDDDSMEVSPTIKPKNASVHTEVQTENVQSKMVQTQISPKRKNSSTENNGKKAKLSSTESVKQFLEDFAVKERPHIDSSLVEQQELDVIELIDEKMIS